MFDIQTLIQLIILFVVIFDPFVSFAVFIVATKRMKERERIKTANLAILVAGILSYLVMIFGQYLMTLFNTTLNDFRVAGGIVLGILGVKMALGHSITNLEKNKNNSAVAIAAIIGTPLLTGPAAITSIIISVTDYGFFVVWLAVSIVLALTGLMLYKSQFLCRYMSKTSIQVISTILGLITLSWGIKFIRVGLGI
jgi:multiple antibiotic resistance protein